MNRDSPTVGKGYADLEYPEDMLALIRDGLPKTNCPKKVLIAGAGMAGLVAGLLLKEAGNEVTILEGNGRFGGRVYTIREPFHPGNYMEMGAMRLPDTHKLVFEYIRRFNLPVNKFNNTNPQDLFFANNILTTRAIYNENPDILQFPVEDWEKGITAQDLFLNAVRPFLDRYRQASDEEKEQMEQQFSSYSMEEFLSDNPYGRSLSPAAIASISVLLGIEGFPEFSFVDILTDVAYPIFSEEVQFYEITGGNDQLPAAFVARLQDNILYNQKVEKIIQTDNGVIMQTRNPMTGATHSFTGDYAIITIPFTSLQFVDVIPHNSISFNKRRAIRELNVLPAVKIGIEFRNKFWEQQNLGNATTDTLTNFSYIPSHNIGTPGPGVMLASYTWGQNALLWNSLPQSEHISYALDGLSKVYGPQVYREFLQGVSFNWGQNPFSAGCFTLFTPPQQKNFKEIIQQPEGRLHFAGEHTSSFHGWIEGAIESGIRTAYEVNSRECP
ncbi:flavin monoamine oxidase family protein [Thalassobacillus pellis]|uniref:flavin monoamine oxidase family protein n=1 Tax=Thalassobacillus pellis TaxID=748008 RepID=UPI001960826B|nr:flavin monoamine oxidase family protein [Thalassobacillus pellis]MBM7554178.1 monoamine oxidase [Thalassobacillus pellis]